jgi:hypothetical protein
VVSNVSSLDWLVEVVPETLCTTRPVDIYTSMTGGGGCISESGPVRSCGQFLVKSSTNLDNQSYGFLQELVQPHDYRQSS